MTTSNLPPEGAIYLDHSGHFVADADEATHALTACGFTVTPFSAQVQPDPETGQSRLTGTGNVCVMLAEGYLEFLVHTADTPIGLEFRAALARRAGLHLAAFAVADAAARNGELEAACFPMRPLVRMSRTIETETGAEEARFTVARLAEGAMPEGRVQILTHGNERALWQPRWLRHANGAQALESIVVAAPDPAEVAARFSRFLGRPAEVERAGQHRIALDRGTVEVLPERMAEDLVGRAIEPGRPSFAACRIRVADLAQAASALDAGGVRHRSEGGRLIVPFPDALGPGAWIFDRAG